MKEHGILLVGAKRTPQRSHAQVFRAHPRCNLVAVASEKGDPEGRAALYQALADDLGVPYIPDLDELTWALAVSSFEAKIAFNAYLTNQGSRAPVRTREDFIELGAFHEAIRRGLEAAQRVEDGLNDPEYQRRLLRRQSLRQAVMTAMAEHDLDASLYPHQRRLVATIGEPQMCPRVSCFQYSSPVFASRQ